MRYASLFRLCVVIGLVATAMVMGGWKWDFIPH